MKVAHWALAVNSGMGRAAASICHAERAAGLESFLVDCQDASVAHQLDDADVHVIHTHAPDHVLYLNKPIVWVAHGTPEVMFHSGYEQGVVNGSYGHGDAWMLAQFYLQHADATVTFWPRHQHIWSSLSDKRTRVVCVPLGVEPELWSPQESRGRYAGSPAVLTAENCYEIKWPLDLFIAWPWVTATEGLHGARLHALYIPKDQHRWWFPLVNRNGCSYHAHIGPQVFDNTQLRNAFCSCDFYIGLVRYGDFNRLTLEARACGIPVISYAGNPYANYWITEGDQRTIAEELREILLHRREPRAAEAPPTIADTAAAMRAVYESL